MCPQCAKNASITGPRVVITPSLDRMNEPDQAVGETLQCWINIQHTGYPNVPALKRPPVRKLERRLKCGDPLASLLDILSILISEYEAVDRARIVNFLAKAVSKALYGYEYLRPDRLREIWSVPLLELFDAVPAPSPACLTAARHLSDFEVTREGRVPESYGTKFDKEKFSISFCLD